MSFDWGSAIGAVASLGSTYLGSKGARDAGKGATAASNASNDLIWRMYQDTNARQQPFYDSGVAALNQYNALLGLGGASTQGQQTNATPTAWFGNNGGKPVVNNELYNSDPRYRAAWDEVAANHQRNFGQGYTRDSDRNALQQHMQELYSAGGQQTQGKPPQMSQQAAFDAFRATPGYQFGLDEGNRSVQASAAARGGLNSGATLKALTRFGQGYADQQGYTPYMNRLSGLFGGAQTAANQTAGYGQNAVNQMGANLQNAAQTRANSTYASNQAWQQGLGSAAGFFGDWYGNRGGG